MLRRASFWIAAVLAGFNSALYYSIQTLSLGPHVILEPWLINQGFRMYDQLTDNHSPLMPQLFSLGQLVVPNGLYLARLALVGLIFLIGILTFILARRIAGDLAGILAVIFFASWSQTFGYGKLWHETFLTPLYLFLLILWTPPGTAASLRKHGLYGLILGIGLLFKQQALFFLIGLAAYECLLAFLDRRSGRLLAMEMGMLVLGAAAPILVYLADYVLTGGTLGQLWYWTVTYNDADLLAMLALPPTVSVLLSLAPAFIFFVVFLIKFLRKLPQKPEAYAFDGLLVLAFLSGTITAIPRFGTFHLQPILPVLAAVSGLELVSLARSGIPAAAGSRGKTSMVIPAAFSIFWLSVGVLNIVNFAPPRKIIEYSNLLPLADQVRQEIGPDACVYILPEDEANSNLYYLLKCLPPRFWAFTSYPWLSKDGLPELELNALKTASPAWVLYFPTRWNVEEHNPALVAYVMSQYQKVDVINSLEGEVWLMKRTTN